MKKALFYAMVMGYGVPSLGRLMAVTSVKGTQLYGRDVEYGNPTHRSITDMTHSFRTEEEARRAVDLALVAHREHQELVDRAEQCARDARSAQFRAVNEAVAGITMDREGLMAHLAAQGAAPRPGSETELRLAKVDGSRRRGIPS